MSKKKRIDQVYHSKGLEILSRVLTENDFSQEKGWKTANMTTTVGIWQSLKGIIKNTGVLSDENNSVNILWYHLCNNLNADIVHSIIFDKQKQGHYKIEEFIKKKTKHIQNLWKENASTFETLLHDFKKDVKEQISAMYDKYFQIYTSFIIKCLMYTLLNRIKKLILTRKLSKEITKDTDWISYKNWSKLNLNELDKLKIIPTVEFEKWFIPHISKSEQDGTKQVFV